MGCVPTGRRINARQGTTNNALKAKTGRPTPTFPEPNQQIIKELTTEVVTVAPPTPRQQPLTPASYKSQTAPTPNHQYKVSTVVGGPPPPGALISQLPPMQPMNGYSQTKVAAGAPMGGMQPEPQRMTSPSMTRTNQTAPRPTTPTSGQQYQWNPQMQYSQKPSTTPINGQSQYRIMQQLPQTPGQQPTPPPQQFAQPPPSQHPPQHQPPVPPPQTPSSSVFPTPNQFMTSVSRVKMSGNSQTTLAPMSQSNIPNMPINQSAYPMGQSIMPDTNPTPKPATESSNFRSAVFGSSNNNANNAVNPLNDSALRELNRQCADVNDENFSEIKVEKMDFAAKEAKGTVAG